MNSFVNLAPSQQDAQGAAHKPGEPWSKLFTAGPVVPLAEGAPPVKSPEERQHAAAERAKEAAEHKETVEHKKKPVVSESSAQSAGKSKR